MRKRSSPEEVPVDVNGNILRAGRGRDVHSFTSGKDTFITALALHRAWKHGAAYRILMIDTSCGKTYPMFAGDFFAMMKTVSMYKGEILGEWGYCQKSSYYGIYLVQEIDTDE